MGSSWLSGVPAAGIQCSVLCFVSLPVQVFVKAQPLAELLQWGLGKWLSCDKGQVSPGAVPSSPAAGAGPVLGSV